jgi:hypothetical protein
LQVRIGRRIGRELLGDDHVIGKVHGAIGALGRVQDRQRGVGQIMLAQALADGNAAGRQEGVGHSATDDEVIDLGDQMAQHVELGRDLGASDHGRNRAFGLAERLFQRLQLRFHGAPGISGQQAGDGFGGTVGAVGGGESVVHIQVAERSHFAGKLGVVLFLARVEAGVFQDGDVARLQLRDIVGGERAGAVADEADRTAQHIFIARVTSDSDISGLRAPLGRPKWASSRTMAPRSASSVTVGKVERSRVSSVTAPSAIGTFRSTRTSARLPATSPRSSRVLKLLTPTPLCSPQTGTRFRPASGSPLAQG